MLFTAINDTRLSAEASRRLRDEQQLLQKISLKSQIDSALSKALFVLDDGIMDAKKLEPEACQVLILNALKIVSRSWSGRMTGENALGYFLEGLKLFPNDVSLWRGMVDVLSSTEDTDLMALWSALRNLNSRVVYPERIDALVKFYTQSGQWDAARKLASKYGIPCNFENVSVHSSPNSFELPSSKLTLSEGSITGYLNLLLYLVEIFDSGKSKVLSLAAPLIITVNDQSAQGSLKQIDSQPDSRTQSDASQVGTPLKRKRSVRQVTVKKKTNDSKPKQLLIDALSSIYPELRGGQNNEGNDVDLRPHLDECNSSQLSVIDRCIALAKILSRDSQSRPECNLGRLMFLCVECFNTRDCDLIISYLGLCPLTCGPSIVHEALNFATSDHERITVLRALKYRNPGKAMQWAAESYPEYLPSFEKCRDIKNLIDSGNFKNIDIIEMCADEDVDEELKTNVLTMYFTSPDSQSQMANILVGKFWDSAWLPKDLVLPRATDLDANIALLLVKSNLHTNPTPSQETLKLLSFVAKARLDSVEALLDSLDACNALYVDDGSFSDLAIELLLGSGKRDLAFQLIQHKFSMPNVLKVEPRFSSDSGSFDYQLRHVMFIVDYLGGKWEEDETIDGELDKVLDSILSSFELDLQTKKAIDINDALLKNFFATPSANMLNAQLPTFYRLARNDVNDVYLKTLLLLVKVQSEQFVNKRRSLDWLKYHKSTLKRYILTSQEHKPEVFAQLGVCLLARLKLQTSSIECTSLAKLLPKFKRILKRSYLSQRVGDDYGAMPFIEMLELILFEGLFQFDIPEATRQRLVDELISALSEIEATRKDWRVPYLYGLAVCKSNPPLACKSHLVSLSLAHSDFDAQCIISAALSDMIRSMDESMRALLKPEYLSYRNPMDLLRRFEKSSAAHLLLHRAFCVAEGDEQEAIIQQLLPFLNKPRAVGLAAIKPSTCERLGDSVYRQELYVKTAIEYYSGIKPSAAQLISIGAKVKSAGPALIVNVDTLICDAVEGALNTQQSLTKEEMKKIRTLVKDLSKSERSTAIQLQLNKL